MLVVRDEQVHVQISLETARPSTVLGPGQRAFDTCLAALLSLSLADVVEVSTLDTALGMVKLLLDCQG